MLKMHPENISAKAVARKIGFFHVGEETESGNLIYHCDFTKRKSK
jgi:RimJ/RimL family protein N-acetyltransferase